VGRVEVPGRVERVEHRVHRRVRPVRLGGVRHVGLRLGGVRRRARPGQVLLHRLGRLGYRYGHGCSPAGGAAFVGVAFVGVAFVGVALVATAFLAGAFFATAFVAGVATAVVVVCFAGAFFAAG